MMRDTRNIRGGGILISSVNANATIKIKQLIEENVGNEYAIQLPPIKNPRVKIARVNDNTSIGEIINDLKTKKII